MLYFGYIALLHACYHGAPWSTEALTDVSIAGNPLLPCSHLGSDAKSPEARASDQPVGLPASQGGGGSGARDPSKARAYRDRAGDQVAVPDQAETAVADLPGGNAGRSEHGEDAADPVGGGGEGLGGHLIIAERKHSSY